MPTGGKTRLWSDSTYEGIGWDFDHVWVWSPSLQRPVLQGLQESGAPTKLEEEEKAKKEGEEKERWKKEEENIISTNFLFLV